MSTNIAHIPQGYHSVTLALTIKGAAAALDFYQCAFGAKELSRLEMPDGSVMHAEMQIGDTRIMVSDEFPDWCAVSPATLGGSPVGLYLYVPDADAAYKRAIDAGAEELHPLQNQFWGDRSGTVKDPFGYKWSLATHVEDVSEKEIQRRAQAWMANPMGTEA